MSRTYSKQTEKYQKYPKINFQEYLIYDMNENQCCVSDSISSELKIELSKDIESMRKTFRHITRRMRK